MRTTDNLYPNQFYPHPTLPKMNPSLGAELGANCALLSEDVRNADKGIALLEAQLAGKTKEILHLKFLVERAQCHLSHLQGGISELRKERHALANEAMRAQGLEAALKRVTAQRDRLQNEVDGVLEGLALEKIQRTLQFDKKDHYIAALTLELMRIREELASVRKNPVAPPSYGVPPNLQMAPESDSHEAWDVEVHPTEQIPSRHRGK